MSEENIDLDSLDTLLPDTKQKESKKVYLKTIEWALGKNEIKNLAITGTYGSGKSSILKTFWESYDGKENVLEISAATFSQREEFSQKTNETNDTEFPNSYASDKNDNSEVDNSIENVLEQHIMQQMFYKVKPEKIPLSRFSRIYNNDSLSLFWDTLLFLFSLLLIYLSLKNNWLNMLFMPSNNENYDSINLFVFILLLLVGLLIIIFTIFRVVKFAKNFRLSTLGIGNTTIELTANNTVFNEYLDEIIYFFSQTDIDIVVFEDLDRFKNLNIFERLRGLNHILNQSEELKEKRIVFIYALKDDIFSKNDNFLEVQNRTKFFDFIIPTVKIMHSSNSESILLNKLGGYIKNEDDIVQKDKLSKKIITDVSLFINDMRILKNICNEYIIYRSALNQSGIIQDKLFAIIVYKNIYPKDFSDLLNGEGKLNSVFNLKQKLIDYHTLKYDEELIEIEATLEKNDEEIADSLYELALIYFGKQKVAEAGSNINFNGNNYQINNKESMELFVNSLIENQNQNQMLEISRQYQGVARVSLTDFVTAKGSSIDIRERAKILIKRNDIGIKAFRRKSQELNRKRNQLRTDSFLELIKKPNELINEKIQDMDLLKVLLMQGWIAEDYDEYITYFYEGAMTKEDINFLKRVRLNQQDDYNYHLKNVNEVQKKLSTDNFYSPAILNYDLLTFLLKANQNQKEKVQKRNYFIDYLSKDISSNYNFISEYINKDEGKLSEETSLFVQLMTETNNNFWMEMKWNIDDKEKEINLFLNLFLTHTPEKLAKLNTENSLGEFIEQNSDFLSWWNEIEMSPDTLNKIKEVLDYLNVRFAALDVVEGSEEIVEMIKENNFYELTIDVLSTLTGETGSINYQTIHECSSAKLKNRIEEEIGKFVSEILLLSPLYSETEIRFLDLMNHKKLSPELKSNLLEEWDGVITHIHAINNKELYSKVIKFNKMKATWSNIESYWSIQEAGEELQSIEDFIIEESNFIVFLEDTERVTLQDFDEGFFEDIMELIITSKNLSDLQVINLLEFVDREITIESISEVSIERYRKLISNKLLSWDKEILSHLNKVNVEIAKDYFELHKDSLTDKELEILVEEQEIPWHQSIYSYLKEKRKKQLAFDYLISFEEHQFLGKLHEVSCDSTTLIDILKNEDLKLDTKLKVINARKNLKVEFNPTVGNWLLDVINKEGFKAIIESIKREIIEEDLLMSLDEQDEISFVLFSCIKYFDYTERDIYASLDKLPEPFCLLVINRKRNTEFKKTPYNSQLLNYLDRKDVIASLSEKHGILSVNNKREIKF